MQHTVEVRGTIYDQVNDHEDTVVLYQGHSIRKAIEKVHADNYATCDYAAVYARLVDDAHVDEWVRVGEFM